MPEFLSRPLEWFRARPRTQQALIGAGVLIVLAAASRAVAVIAVLVFFVAAVAFLVQLVRRRPARGWMFAALGSLAAAVVFFALAGAIYGPAEEQANEPAPREEPVVEEEQEPPRDQEEEPAPEPQEEQAQEDEPEPGPEPEPEPVEEEHAALPGVAGTDMVAVADAHGLECTIEEGGDVAAAFGGDRVVDCEATDANGLHYIVGMVTRDAPGGGAITHIDASLADYDGGRGFGFVAIEFLGDIAAAATPGDPEAARAWVADNLPGVDIVEADIDGGHFVLRGTPEIDDYDYWDLVVHPAEE